MPNCPHCGVGPSKLTDDLSPYCWMCGANRHDEAGLQDDACRIRELEQQLVEAKNVIAAMRDPFEASPGIIHRLNLRNEKLEAELDKVTKDYEWWDKVIARIIEAVYDGNVAQDQWDVDGLIQDVTSAYENKLKLDVLDKEPGDDNN